MALAIDVELLTGTYEAGLGGERPEWPPHPARLFCALVAQARSDTELDALRWLEQQGAAEVLASSAAPSTLRAFVPVNAVVQKTKSNYVARTNGQRAWPRALPAVPFVRFHWSEATPSGELSDTLRSLGARVSYLGRPAGMVLVTVHAEPSPLGFNLHRFVPAEDGPELLRVPYPGYVEALRSAFASDEAADTVSRKVSYAEVLSDHPPPSAPSEAAGPYARLFTLGFPPGSGIAGWHAARVARAFRDAVLSRLGAPLPTDPWPAFQEPALTSIHGHAKGIEPTRRCAFLPLPFVGSAHATGDLVGVGIAVGADVDPELRRALLQLLGLDRDEGPRLTTLHVPRPGITLPLAPADDRWTLEPDRWRGPASRWASVLPVILDRWPKRRHTVESLMAESLVLAGYPLPTSVEVRRGSAIAGAPLLRRGDRKRRASEPDRAWAHVVLEFPRPVVGPVVVGNLRFLGLGLCSPLRDGDG